MSEKEDIIKAYHQEFDDEESPVEIRPLNQERLAYILWNFIDWYQGVGGEAFDQDRLHEWNVELYKDTIHINTPDGEFVVKITKTRRQAQ